MLSIECKKELTEDIIPFWNNLKDEENGGFYGYVSNALVLDKKAPKGVILHSRILWFYSNAYLTLKDEKCLEMAKHAYRFLSEYAVDKENGGVYWMLNYDGSVNDSMKHTYCQAFFVYAMSSYYDASRDENALKLALDVYNAIEKNCRDDVAYLEALSKEWVEIENDALSENGLMADKTMNTTLHLLEAYTELYRVCKNEEVLKNLCFQLQLVLDKIYDKENGKLFVFFDKNLNEIGDIYSYGHDIEATWLIDRACDVIGDAELSRKCSDMNKVIVENILNRAMNNGRLNNEVEKGIINKWHIWWVQAEGVVGFYNAYQRYNDSRYLNTANSLWNYIKEKVVDTRNGGEWHSQLDDNDIPADFKPVVDPWKCPYHNGRMCLEMINRN